MSTTIHWQEHETATALQDAIVTQLRRSITAAIAERGQALLALSGGKTPVPIFERLAAEALPWAQVTVIPVDDRLVPRADALSNVAMLTRILAPAGARVLALAPEGADHATAGPAADRLLQGLAWPPDFCWLGMGNDGHTASIFVGPDFESALHPPAGVRAVSVRPDPLPPEAPVDRVTLTAPAIAEARETIVVIQGAAKLALLRQAIAEGARSAWPIGRVLAGLRGPVTVHAQVG